MHTMVLPRWICSKAATRPRKVRQDVLVSGFILKLGAAAIVLGVFGLLLSADLPEGALIVGGFAVAVGAVLLGLRLRPDERGDREG